MGQGNLITELVLIGDHGSAVLILPTHRHPASNPGARARPDRYTGEVIDPRPQIGDTHLRISEWSEDVVLDGIALVGAVGFVHKIGRENRGESQEGRMVRFDRDDRISRNEIALLKGILNRKGSLEWISFILITAGQSVFAVDQIIEIAHAIMVLKNGGYRIVLKRVPCIRTSRIHSRTGNQITAVRELELKKTDCHWIDVKRWITHRSVRTLNLYATVGSGVVQVSGPIARRLRTDGCR